MIKYKTILIGPSSITSFFTSLKRIPFMAAVLSAGLILSGCSVHKIDVQQGNVITQEVLEKLSIGMEKSKVSRLLGTPLVEDPFHKGRWDYVYKFTAGNTDEVQSSHIILYFDNDSLTKIDVRKAPPAEADVKKPSIRKR